MNSDRNLTKASAIMHAVTAGPPPRFADIAVAGTAGTERAARAYSVAMIHRGQALVAVGVVSLAAGCGQEAVSPSAERQQRAHAAGFDVDLAYVTDVDGYHAAAGGAGVYGDAGFQIIYASPAGDDLRLTVERRSLTATNCPALPIAGQDEPGVTVTCVRDGDGWRRTGGQRHEHAVTRGGLLIRASGQASATTAAMLRSAATEARPATSEELVALLPPTPPGPVDRGDIVGDNAPHNPTGPGG